MSRWSEARPVPRSVLRITLLTRLSLFALCVAVGLVGNSISAHPWAFIVLGVVAVVANIPPLNRSRIVPIVEAVITTTLVLSTNPLDAALLPYLLAPCLAAGLIAGFGVAITAAGLSALALLASRFVGLQTAEVSSYFAEVAQWVVLGFAVGALASWTRRVQEAQEGDEDSAYAEAYRLLSDLSRVSRELTEGLDPVGIGQILLQTVQTRVLYSWGALQLPTPGGGFVILTQEGRRPTASGPTRKDADSPWAQAWHQGTTVVQHRSLDGEPDHVSVVVPLQTGGRTIGLLGIQRAEGEFSPDSLALLERLSRESALRLDTALLFTDIRSIATAEERRRLAREIHDGIAQELASLGYAVDDMSARADDPEMETSLKGLRAELSRVIGELRMSIFDLRSEVAPAGLGATLADYARWVGTTSELDVHLTLDESPQRLRVEVESELLRIAQEAITNARKHAGARNLWVRCSVSPPDALLTIEDDGRGLGTPRVDSYGLEIMRERSQRVGATLRIDERADGGTVVEVLLGRGARLGAGPGRAPALTPEGGSRLGDHGPARR